MHRVGSVARRRFEELSDLYSWPRSARSSLILHIPELTKKMLMSGQHLALLPRSVAMPWLMAGEVGLVECGCDMALPPLGVLWQPDRSGPATEAFVHHLKAGLRAD